MDFVIEQASTEDGNDIIDIFNHYVVWMQRML